jgi:8-oxo-dGTP pyrophosphatase MutT (NUDIX family)
MNPLLHNTAELIPHVGRTLHDHARDVALFPAKGPNLATSSAVMLLLGPGKADGREPILILNKRSSQVPQPGDLCCPGGSMSPRLDRYLAAFLAAPGLPLSRWRHWSWWRRQRPADARLISLFFATAIRESFEEMRLNPFRVRFLGVLPPQGLVMFNRVIYPMVAWVPRQRRFRTNWEVEKVVRIPLGDLLNPDRYARYCIRFDSDTRPALQEFPCFKYQENGHSEPLWGATYRIVSAFLELVFNFSPPDDHELPIVNGRLGKNYLTGGNS